MTTPEVAKSLDAALASLLASDAPLKVRLEAYAGILRERNQLFAEAVDRLVERLLAVGAGASAPRVGDALPEFLLPSDDDRLISLSELLARGPLVLAFRRGHWCPYCQIATDALARAQNTINSAGGHIAVITPDREAYTRQLKMDSGARFPILSDLDNGYALSIGLAISVGEEMRDFMTARGRDLGAYQGSDAWLLPIPATFVVDRQAVIRMRHVDPDYRTRASSDDIIAALADIA
ncbi:MAG: peroxiredoxin-like family protein [Hyphomicrobiaceae bacterium]